MKYNWQQKDWPNFKYKTEDIDDNLFDFAQRTGRIGGVLDGFSESEQSEAMINLMVSEAIKTSEIEGEYLRKYINENNLFPFFLFVLFLFVFFI